MLNIWMSVVVFFGLFGFFSQALKYVGKTPVTDLFLSVNHVKLQISEYTLVNCGLIWEYLLM